MIPTATVLAFFAWAYIFGLELGLCYGFLRPLRPRHTGAADLLFLLALYRKAAVLMFVNFTWPLHKTQFRLYLLQIDYRQKTGICTEAS